MSILEVISEFHYLLNLIWQNWDLKNAGIFLYLEEQEVLSAAVCRLIALCLEAQVIPE